jgi:hypothetical protein
MYCTRKSPLTIIKKWHFIILLKANKPVNVLLLVRFEVLVYEFFSVIHSNTIWDGMWYWGYDINYVVYQEIAIENNVNKEHRQAVAMALQVSLSISQFPISPLPYHLILSMSYKIMASLGIRWYGDGDMGNWLIQSDTLKAIPNAWRCSLMIIFNYIKLWREIIRD